MSRLPVVLGALLSIPLTAQQEGKAPDLDLPEAHVTVTDHRMEIGGNEIAYRATAGTLRMTDDADEPIALMGFTAYTAQGVDPSQRPILFAYNGGPGSASLWLHMGVLGPQRAVVEDAGFGTNGPFQRVDNQFSILDEADLVMIDPVGTGFSKPIGKGEGKDFWGVDQDIHSVSEFIVRYVTENGRWASPKLVLGESYGGMRTGGVSYYLLDRHFMTLNGVVLVSPFMEMATGFAGNGIDLPHVLFLSTFAATAWYHEAIADRPDDLRSFLDEVERFALDSYAPALLRGASLPAAERQRVLAGLARYTGLSTDYWDRANLRIDEGQFTKELLRSKGITVGRIDSRFAGTMIHRIGESMSYDPMTTAIGPGYLAAFMDYYRKDLKVEGASDYAVFGDVGEWDWGHRVPGQSRKSPMPNTSIDLAHAMARNPSMKVLVQQGYFDLATPYQVTQYYLDHMDLTPELRENIQVAYYEAGHMMYVHEPSLVQFKRDLAAFVRAACGSEAGANGR